MSGRRDELGFVRHAVLGGTRLVTLTGAGGVGKTWIARRAVVELGRPFADGVVVVELGEPDGVVSLDARVADALELQVPPGTEQDEVTALVQLLADRHLLLVLDGCDPLLPGLSRVVAELLRRCRRLHVLVTSRQPLGVTGEHVLPVSALSVPEDPSTVDLVTARAHGAVALFVQRAAAAMPGFRLTEANVGAVCEICRRLDGNPLASELAAAQSQLLGPQAILERLDDRYRLLVERDAVGSPPASLRASVDASWELCTESERRLWARMSVMPADVDLDAVEAVCTGDGIEEADVLDLVDSLLGKSVLAREADSRSVRYRLPETLRAYGVERLGPTDARRWSARHVRWVERLAHQASAEWFGPRQTYHLRGLEREYAHLSWALDRTTTDPEEAPRALDTLVALDRWWPVGGRVSQARRWLAATLRHGTGTPDQRVRALALASWLATYEADLDHARADLDHASALLEQATVTGDASSPTRSALARARGALATAMGELALADACFEEVVGRAVRSGTDAGAAEGWLLLGLARALGGRPHDAERALRRCVALCERAGEGQLRATALALEAAVARSDGRDTSALLLAREALRAKAGTGDWVTTAVVLEVIATVSEDPVRGAVLLGAADHAWRRVGVTPTSLGPFAVPRETWSAKAREALGRRELDRHLARGATLTWEKVLGHVEDDVVPRQRRSAARVPLTARELAVAELVARGMTNREIAATLVISVRTVQGHLEHILRKLGFGSRAQVAVWVAQREAETTGS